MKPFDIQWEGLKSLEMIRLQSRDLLNSPTAPVKISEKKYSALLKKMGDLVSQYAKEPSFFTYSDQFNRDNLIALHLFFSVVNYCFQNPFTRQSYIFTTQTSQKIPRSFGLFTALASSPIEWTNFIKVRSLPLSDWSNLIVGAHISEVNLYDYQERFNRIVKFADYLVQEGFSTISDFLEIKWDTQELLNLLVGSDLFEDPFLKRAQLVTSQISDIYFFSSGNTTINTQPLTMMADYRIPQLLYNFGVIEFVDKKLPEALSNKEVILEGSVWEMSLRSSAIVIGNMLSKGLKSEERIIDTILWKLSKNYTDENRFLPHMLVPTRRY